MMVKRISIWAFNSIILFSLHSCITYNIIFVPESPENVSSSDEDLIRAKDFEFKCFVPYYNRDELIIINHIDWETQNIKIDYQYPVIYLKQDSIKLDRLDNKKNFFYKDIEDVNIEDVNKMALYLKYTIIDNGGQRTVSERFLLKRKKKYFFTTH
jgi:hypothetical protein